MGRTPDKRFSQVRWLWLLVLTGCCFFMAAPKLLAGQMDDEIAARQGLEEILDLWRGEEFEVLSLRMIYPAGVSRGSFLERIVYASRVPACCWEKLQDVEVVWLGDGRVYLNARVGLEAEGFGVRFVKHAFPLVKEDGVWKVPVTDILSLAAPNLQRIPRKIPLRQE